MKTSLGTRMTRPPTLEGTPRHMLRSISRSDFGLMASGCAARRRRGRFHRSASAWRSSELSAGSLMPTTRPFLKTSEEKVDVSL